MTIKWLKKTALVVVLALAPAVFQTIHAQTRPGSEPARLAQNVARERVFHSYHLIRERSPARISSPALVTGGSRVFNDVTRQSATVSGNITVIATEGTGLTELAQRFGMTLVTGDARARIGVLAAPDGADLIALLARLRSSDQVKAARIEVIEPRNRVQALHTSPKRLLEKAE